MLETYLARHARFSEEAARLRARFEHLSMYRLISFVVGVAVVILAYAYLGLVVGFVATLIFLGAFSRFVAHHGRIDAARRHAEALALVNEREAAVLRGDWSAFFDGKKYLDPGHPYALDLDIFGPHSFYQFANRTATALGADRLANWLANPTDAATVRARQLAVADLSDRLDWRQHVQAHGMNLNDQTDDARRIEEWLAEPDFVSNNALLKVAIWIAPFYAALALYLAAVHVPAPLWVFLLLPPGFILYRTKAQVDRVHELTERGGAILERYAGLIGQIEGETFFAPLLVELTARFRTGDRPPSRRLARLGYLIRQLNLRDNFFAIFFNLGSLWDLRHVWKLERWRADLREELPRWFEALAELEALISFATVRANRPDWTFPILHETEMFVAEQLGHPLLKPEKRVDNDFSTPTRGHIKLLTGSNMAGKSTFLRAVGLNAVLARVGSVVCARRMELPELEVYTSMRTVDALHEDTSSFYAELKRLKFIIEATEAGRPVYFLLDEILKGTNSRDRHRGSRALIDQLIAARGAGIIATHDLELGDLEAQSNGTVENWRIEVEIEDGELHFDYLLKRGVTQSFNATELMRRMGIRVTG